MKAVILQSNYLPWKGYFDLIASADVFMFYDEVQYTKNDWRNRNQVKGKDGLIWLTVPVGIDLKRRVCDVEVKDQKWKGKHRKVIESSYAQAPFMQECVPLLDTLFAHDLTNLSEINQLGIKTIAKGMGLKAKFLDSRAFPGEKLDPTARLIFLLQAIGADHYVSGPAAKEYLDESQFAAAGIKIEYFSYANYREYPQLHGPFVHNVSVLDLILNVGWNCLPYLEKIKG